MEREAHFETSNPFGELGYKNESRVDKPYFV
jgi:hypothetical protein